MYNKEKHADINMLQEPR